MKYIQVAVPVPIRQVFTYLVDATVVDVQSTLLGKRVLVPFGKRKLVAVCVQYEAVAPIENAKTVLEVLDEFPVMDLHLLTIAHWLSEYYLHPIGEIISAMIPVRLRRPTILQECCIEEWQIHADRTDAGLDLKNKQKQLFDLLSHGNLPLRQIKHDYSASVIKALKDKKLIHTVVTPEPFDQWFDMLHQNTRHTANVEQSLAISSINQADTFECFLLEGVTGSGKTEVYLQAIEKRLQRRQQILILVPEIGLTPQTVQRFEARFGPIVAALHSGQTDHQRLQVWHQARRGDKAIFIGTRSSIFLPFRALGMIIVDEEHDESYKQHDGLRYHARDLAVYRAQQLNIPLVMGSATPSLESLKNALQRKYHHLILGHRAANASMPKQHLFNLNGASLKGGIATGLLQKIRDQLTQGNQVLLFVNRRGYAPALLCHDCGHVEVCQGCEMPYTVHKLHNNLQCHRCGQIAAIPTGCSECGSAELVTQGMGTEKLERFLSEYFPQYRSIRIDSDSTRSREKFNAMLSDINAGNYQILVGTQILSKGHHFPNVTLAIIVNIDSLLFSGDFRASERVGQLITQLSGRAGRANKPGELWLQTHQPGHPLLQDLINNGYSIYARTLLHERKIAKLPPFSFQALIRAESQDIDKVVAFLSYASLLLRQFDNARSLPSMPCLVEKKQGRYRYQVLATSESRQYLINIIKQVITELERHKLSNLVRWHVDIQPIDMS